MKIALVCPYDMFGRAGGVHQLVTHLYEGLKKKGHEVKIITPRPVGYHGPVPKDYILLGTTRSFKSGLGTAGNWGSSPDGGEIQATLDREKFEVINFHEPWVPMLGWQILNYSKAAHVGTLHANLVDSVAAKSWVNMFIPYGRNILQKMHVLTAVSPAPAAMIINKASRKHEKELVASMKYIANGIDLNFYKPFKKRQPLSGPNSKTIVYVGRLDRRKGVDYLIEAFALVYQEAPNTHLIIAGEGDRREKLEQAVKAQSIKNVKFVGYVTEEEKRRLMGNADVYCSPALFGESFGIVLLEAMALGTPIVAGRNLGYINVMSGYGRLGLVDPKATEDFAQRLIVFLTEPDVRGRFRAWELSEVKKYDYAKIVDQYEAAYQQAYTKWRAAQHLNTQDDNHDKGFWKTKRRLSLRRFTR